MNLDPDLLPAPGVSVRCAPFAETLDVDPSGTALHVDEIAAARPHVRITRASLSALALVALSSVLTWVVVVRRLESC